MKFTIETHQDRIFQDPQIEVVETVDDPRNKTFTPRVHITDSTGVYSHTLPAQPYVNGTWDDTEVMLAIETYFNGKNLDNKATESSIWDKLNPLKWFS